MATISRIPLGFARIRACPGPARLPSLIFTGQGSGGNGRVEATVVLLVELRGRGRDGGRGGAAEGFGQATPPEGSVFLIWPTGILRLLLEGKAQKATSMGRMCYLKDVFRWFKNGFSSAVRSADLRVNLSLSRFWGLARSSSDPKDFADFTYGTD
ncbi:hypothetical protein B0H16DRAFT_1479489 [Mycena metata]|uniref:Uncharacterized protein n=1 Tax=Mycena metata TaxID=1033252 RepID=A0AAD7H603_9AGAR|nr:hypothetical protein B0H16DRAFT_1479489 [Mycena metata]